MDQDLRFRVGVRVRGRVRDRGRVRVRVRVCGRVRVRVSAPSLDASYGVRSMIVSQSLVQHTLFLNERLTAIMLASHTLILRLLKGCI